jgi:hypothetical protein
VIVDNILSQNVVTEVMERAKKHLSSIKDLSSRIGLLEMIFSLLFLELGNLNEDVAARHDISTLIYNKKLFLANEHLSKSVLLLVKHFITLSFNTLEASNEDSSPWGSVFLKRELLDEEEKACRSGESLTDRIKQLERRANLLYSYVQEGLWRLDVIESTNTRLTTGKHENVSLNKNIHDDFFFSIN